MTAILALVLRFWRPLLAVLIVLAAMLWIRHYGAQRFHAGYQQATSEDAAALAQQIHDATVKETADALRLQRANHDLQEVRGQLAARRTEPVHHVVCHAKADPSRVPETAGLPDVVVASAGDVPGSPRPDSEFDPTVELYALADTADDMLASCRYLHQSVHGIPSTQLARPPAAPGPSGYEGPGWMADGKRTSQVRQSLSS